MINQFICGKAKVCGFLPYMKSIMMIVDYVNKDFNGIYLCVVVGHKRINNEMKYITIGVADI